MAIKKDRNITVVLVAFQPSKIEDECRQRKKSKSTFRLNNSCKRRDWVIQKNKIITVNYCFKTILIVGIPKNICPRKQFHKNVEKEDTNSSSLNLFYGQNYKISIALEKH
jgi:hypothetical protein